MNKWAVFYIIALAVQLSLCPRRRPSMDSERCSIPITLLSIKTCHFCLLLPSVASTESYA
jgi:hypothetical protein